MLYNIFVGIILCFISFIPIVFWGYLFSCLDDSTLNKKRFFAGVLSGIISVLPILYLGDFINKTNFFYLNVFSYIKNLSNILDLKYLIISLSFNIIILATIPFFLLSFKSSIDKIKIYLKNIFIFLIFSLFIGILLYSLNYLFSGIYFLQQIGDYDLSFGKILFNSVKLVIFYYIIAAFLEELSKFFCFNYSSYFYIKSHKQGVLYAIFVALGFSFLENILYFKFLMENYGFGKELISVFFSRNIFSLLLHVICSSIFAYFFSIAYIKYKHILNIKYISIIFVGFMLSILIHAIFNILLSLNFTFIIFIYLIGGYFYLTYIFYKD